MSYQSTGFAKSFENMRKQGKERKFLESVELMVALRDLNLKDPSQRFNLEVKLPHSMKREIKIALFADGDMEIQANSLGFTAINTDRFNQLSKNPKEAKKLADDHDFFLAERKFMPKVGRFLGKILGPRGKMPKPVQPGTDLAEVKDNYSKTIRLRLRENPCINARIGTLENTDEELAENAVSAMASLQPKLARGSQNVRKVYVKTTMGPAVTVE